jgi:hypothetical protein
MFRSLPSEQQFPVPRWEVLADLVMWSYNTANVGVLGDKSPFELLHRRAPRRPLDLMLEFARRDRTDPKSVNSAILHDTTGKTLQTSAYLEELTTRLRKNTLTPPPLTRFRWHEPVLAHVGSRRRTVLRTRRPRQVQD